MTTEATKYWRKLVKNGNPCRDSSPLPESVAAPYKKPRAPDERAEALAKLRRLHEERHPDRVHRNKPIRKTRTNVELNAEQINKVFYERDILKDKLRRRNDEIDEMGYEIRCKNARIRRKNDEIDHKDYDIRRKNAKIRRKNEEIDQLKETIRSLKDE